MIDEKANKPESTAADSQSPSLVAAAGDSAADETSRLATARAELELLRAEINETDGQLIEALARRHALSRRVVVTKIQHGLPLRDTKREEALLGRVVRLGVDRGLDAAWISGYFKKLSVTQSAFSRNSWLLRATASNLVEWRA